MIIIGLSGRIASGKSLVSKFLHDVGIKVIDADVLSREACKKNTICYKKIVKEFGKNILNAQQEIDRKKLGSIVFSDSNLLKRLESIVHPAVILLKNNYLAKYKEEKVVVYASALLFENNLDKEVQKIIYITVTDDILFKRALLRGSLSAEQVKNILSKQLPDEKKLPFCDEVINNNGDIEFLKMQLKNTWKRLTNMDLII
jgi:dephospho-CoA kinase